MKNNRLVVVIHGRQIIVEQRDSGAGSFRWYDAHRQLKMELSRPPLSKALEFDCVALSEESQWSFRQS